MTIGIIAAMAEELAHLLAHLEHRRDVNVLEGTYYIGRLGQHDVVLVQSGIGKVMSAMTVAILVQTFEVDAIINTGSAGAVAEGIAIGDVVVADRLAYHDVDVTAFGYAYGQMAQQPLYFECDPAFVASFKETLADLNHRSHIGLLLTGDSFIAGADRISAIKEHFPDVLAVEMEGAAIAQAAHSLGKPFIVVRAMSDTADHDASVTFDEFIRQAGQQSATVLLQFLEGLPR